MNKPTRAQIRMDEEGQKARYLAQFEVDPAVLPDEYLVDELFSVGEGIGNPLSGNDGPYDLKLEQAWADRVRDEILCRMKGGR